jgi:putative tricarboxylic transport membrane protein
MEYLDKCSSLILFLISVYVCIESFRVGLGTLSRPDAGLFPFIQGIVLGTLSLIVFLIKGDRFIEAFKKTIQTIIRWKWRNSLLVIMALFAYAALLETLGFILSAFLLVFFLYGIVEPKKIHIALITAIFSTLFSYSIFHILIKAHLPKGFF